MAADDLPLLHVRANKATLTFLRLALAVATALAPRHISLVPCAGHLQLHGNKNVLHAMPVANPILSKASHSNARSSFGPVASLALGFSVGVVLHCRRYSSSALRPTLTFQAVEFAAQADLTWPSDEDELTKINAVRAELASKMEGCPGDMTHDISIARFLRGHRNDVQEAAEYMGKALTFRMKAIKENAVVRKFRESIAGATTVDMDKLPFADEMLKLVPLKAASGETSNGLPLMVLAPKLVDYATIAAYASSDKLKILDTFLVAHLEQRWIVLNNLSLQQGRMVKFVDLRDFNRAPILSILARAPPFLAKAKEVLGVIQDYYPEIVHQAYFFNAPGLIARVLSILNSLLNDRMRSKLQVFPSGETFARMSERLSAKAICSWMDMVHGVSELDDLIVSRGSEQYLVRWLIKGQALQWSISVSNSPIRLSWCFVAQEASPGLLATTTTTTKQESVAAGSCQKGDFIAENDGVWCICLSTVGILSGPATVSLSLE